MPSEPENGSHGPDRLHQFGTIWSDGGDGAFANPIAGFSLYPVPGFAPAYDPVGSGVVSSASADLAGPQTGVGTTGTAISDNLGNAGSVVIVQTAGSSTGLVINPSFDPTITTLSATLRNEIETAISAAIRFYETTFTNSITFSIDFGYGEYEGGLAVPPDALSVSSDNGVLFLDTSMLQTYPTLRADMEAHVIAAGGSALPASDPFFTGPQDGFFVPNAEAEALGIASTGSVAGYIGLAVNSAAFPLNFSTTDLAVSGSYDVVGALEHEIAEVMGRVAGYSGGEYNPLDLFRYASKGTLATSGTAAYFSINGGTTNLGWFNDNSANGGDAQDWNSSRIIIGGVTMLPVVDDAYDAFSGIGVANTVSAVDLTEMEMLGYTMAVCFAAGTRIATPSGEVPVEKLSVGDKVLTVSGTSRPIVWIGIGQVPTTRRRRGAGSPVIVRHGALADDVPNHDLRVTKGHALYLDGLLIPVEELINGRSIVWDDQAQELSIYHIELDMHDVLLANGAPVESYRDDGNRWLFRNINAAWHLPPQPPCAPLSADGPVVASVWRRLLERTGRHHHPALTEDADLHLLVDGRRVDAIERGATRHEFRLHARPRSARLRSRSVVPQDVGLARDPRALGVAVRRFVFAHSWSAQTVEAATLTDGYHDYEPSEAIRWTNGDAAIPASLFAGMNGPGVLWVELGPATRYRDEAERPRIRAA